MTNTTWTHRDLLRLSHPKSDDPAFQGLAEWILRGDATNAPRLVEGFEKAKKAPVSAQPVLIREYGLTWEMVPTEALNDPKVWEALLDGNVPLGALIRQLPRLTRIGVLGSLSTSPTAHKVIARLQDKNEIEKSRIHPINVLIALKTYASGHGDKGSSTWTPVKGIVNALDKAFYLAFKNVEPSNKRTLIGLDVSGSMSWTENLPGNLTPREATAAVALVIEATEPSTHVIGFTGGAGRGYGYGSVGKTTSAGTGEYGSVVTDLDSTVSSRRRLDDVVKDLERLPMGRTDCALPMLYALEEGLEVDTFIIMTDNETWAGTVHPFEALKQYRAKTGIDAKLIVMSTESSKFSIADPSDPGMLDIAGFDSAAPALISDFSRGL